VQRSVNGGPYVVLQTLAANETSYVDSNITSGTNYSYQIIAIGAGTMSDAASPGASLAVSYQDHAPVATDQAFRVHHGGNVSGSVLTGAYDVDGNPMTVTLMDPQPAGFAYTPDGAFTYTAGQNVGDLALRFIVSDGALTTTATVTITTWDGAPLTSPDTYYVHTGQTVSGDVKRNDVDAEGDTALTAIPGGNPPAKGTLNLNPDGTFTYTAFGTSVGKDTFSYYLSDGAAQSSLTAVTIVIQDEAPFAHPDFATVSHGKSVVIPVLANDWDPDSGTTHQEPKIVTLPGSGQTPYGTAQANPDGTITFTANNTLGTATFSYELSDGALSATGTVSVDVTNVAPQAIADSFRLQEYASVQGNVLQNDIPGDDDPLTISLISGPQDAGGGGSFSFDPSNGHFSYTPTSGFSGLDSFRYQISDGVATPSPAMVTLAVLGGFQNATPDDYTVVAGQTLTQNLLAAAQTVPPGDATQPPTDPNFKPTLGFIESQRVPLGGTVSTSHGTITAATAEGFFTYHPNPGFVGDDTFSYGLTDAASPSIPVTIHVTATAPSAGNGPTLAVDENSTVTIPFSQLLSMFQGTTGTGGQSDIDPSTLSIDNGRYGSTSIIANGSDPLVRYTPMNGFYGTDSFACTVNSKEGLPSSPAYVHVTVNKIIGPVTAQSDTASVLEGGSVTIPVLANDTDANGIIAPSSVQLTVTQPTHGTATVVNNQVVYTPDPNYHFQAMGISGDSFTYHVQSTDGHEATATAMIGIDWVNHAPVAVDDTLTLAGGASQGSVNVIQNDSDFDTTRFTARHISIVTPPANGIAVPELGPGGNFDGNITYIPNPGFYGSDSFQYAAFDSDWVQATATVNVVVGQNNTTSATRVTPGAQSSVTIAPMSSVIWDQPNCVIKVSNGSSNGGQISAYLGSDGVVHVSPASGDNTTDYSVTATGGGKNNFGVHYTLQWSGAAAKSLYLSAQTFDNLSVGDVAGVQVAGDLSVSASGIVTGPLGGANVQASANSLANGITATADVLGADARLGPLGNVTATGNIASANSGDAITGHLDAGGNIGTVQAQGNIIGSLDAKGNLQFVSSGRQIADDHIHAGGYITSIAATTGIATAITAGGQITVVTCGAGSISGSISGGGDVGLVLDGSPRSGIWAMQDITATVHSDGLVKYVTALQDIKGRISGNTIDTVQADRDVTGAVRSESTISYVTAGRDLTSSITAAGEIRSVSASRTLSGSIQSDSGLVDAVYDGSGSSTYDVSIQGATITGPAGVGTVSARAAHGHGGGIIATITSSAGAIGLVSADGGVYATFTAQTTIGNVVAGNVNPGTLDGRITATTGAVGPVVSKQGAMAARITAGTDVLGVTASGDIRGAVDAGGNITSLTSTFGSVTSTINAHGGNVGNVWAGADVSGDIEAGTTIGDVTAGHSITGTIAAGGNLGDVVAGFNPATPGDIGATISAGGNIGNVTARGSATSVTPIGAVPDHGGAPKVEDHIWDASAGIPAAPTLSRITGLQKGSEGNISGVLDAGGSIGSITALGSISDTVAAAGSIGNVWAVGDVTNSLTEGSISSPLNVVSWGTVGAAIDSGGDLLVSAYNAISNSARLTSDNGGIAASAWGDVAAAITAKDGISAWALGDLSSTLSAGENILQSAWGTISSHIFSADEIDLIANALSGFTVDHAFSLTCDVWNDLSLPSLQLGGFLVCFTGGNCAIPRGQATSGIRIAARGNVSGAVDAGAHADVVVAAKGDVTLTNNSFIVANMNVSGANVTLTNDSQGTVTNLDVDAAANASINIDVQNHIRVRAGGTVSGRIRSEGTADVLAEGNVEAKVTAWAGAAVTTWGNLSGDVSAAAGAVSVQAYGNVTGAIVGQAYVNLISWGDVSGNVSSVSEPPPPADAVIGETPPIQSTGHGGHVTLFAAGQLDGNVIADGDVDVEVWKNIIGSITAGYVASGPNAAPSNANVTALGNISNYINSSGDLGVSALGNITGSGLNAGGAVDVEVLGTLTDRIDAGKGITVRAQSIPGARTFSSSAGVVDVLAQQDIGNLSVTADGTVNVSSGGTATISVTTYGDADPVNLTALTKLTKATVQATDSPVSIVSGGDSEIHVGEADSLNVVVDGILTGDATTAGGMSLFAKGNINYFLATTTGANGAITAATDAALSGTYSAGNGLSISSIGNMTGSFTAGTSPNVSQSNAFLSSLGTLSNATVRASGGVSIAVGDGGSGGGGSGQGLDVTAGYDANVTVGGSLDGTVYSGHDATVSALGGDVSGTIEASHLAYIAASGNVSADVYDLAGAPGSAEVHAFGNFSGAINVGGNATVIAQGALSGTVTTSAGDIDVQAASVTGNVTAGGNASVFSDGVISVPVTANRDLVVQAQGTISKALSGATVDAYSNGDITGNDTATGGSLTLLAGGRISGADSSITGDAVLTAVGPIASLVVAAGNASVSTFSDFTGSVLAFNNAAVSAQGNVSAPITASASVSLEATGNLSATVTAGQSADLTVLGGISAPVVSGQDATINAWGDVTANITATAGKIALTTWGALTDRLHAGSDVTAQAAGAANITVESGGNASIASFAQANVNITSTGWTDLAAYGDITQSQINAGTFLSVSGEGNVDATGNAGATLKVSAQGTLTGTWTSVGNADLTAVGDVQVTSVHAGGDLSLTALADLSGGDFTTPGTADLTAWGSVFGVTVSGDQGSRLTGVNNVQGTFHSLYGGVTVDSGGNVTLAGNCATNLDAAVLGNLQFQSFQATYDAHVASGGDMSGQLAAGGTAIVRSDQTMGADVTAGSDLSATAVNSVAGALTAGRDLSVFSYGSINANGSHAMTAARDILYLWARGDIVGSFVAGGTVGWPGWVYAAVQSYANIDASITAQTGSIFAVQAWGNIATPAGGAFAAGQTIGAVRAGGAITATLSAPVVEQVTPNDSTINKSVAPQSPDLSGLAATRNALLAGVQQLRQAVSDLTAAKSGLAAQQAAAAASASQARSQIFNQLSEDRQQAVGLVDEASLAVNNALQTGWTADNYSLAHIRYQLKDGAKLITEQAPVLEAGLQDALNSAQLTLTQAAAQDQAFAGVMAADVAKLTAAKAAMAAAEAANQAHNQAMRGQQWEKQAKSMYRAVAGEIWDANKQKWLDELHTALNIASTICTFIPPLIVVARVIDGVNASVYLMEGRYLEAGITAVSAIPFGKLFHVAEEAGSAGRLLGETEHGVLADARLADGAVRDAESLAQREANGGFSNAVKGCGEVGECFTAGTQVVTSVDASGHEITKNIQDVHVGDEVLTRDENDPSAPLQEQQVTGVSQSNAFFIEDVTVLSPDGTSETIQATRQHPFYVEGLGWTRAVMLQAGQKLTGPDGQELTVVGVTEESHPDGVAVYNFTVGTDHTYFVDMGRGAVWVHNGACKFAFPGQVGGTAEFPEFRSFSTAQRNALGWLEERGFTTGKVTVGKFGEAAGLPNGLKSEIGNIGYRIEFDINNAAHINVFAGKIKGPHFKFPGNQQSVLAILNQLF
jgi:cytoskeletal protein CcmA (bactofilin family)